MFFVLPLCSHTLYSELRRKQPEFPTAFPFYLAVLVLAPESKRVRALKQASDLGPWGAWEYKPSSNSSHVKKLSLKTFL